MQTVKVPIDDVRLSRLLQLYLHEWSGKLPVPLGPDGLFVYPHLPRWQDDPQHDAVLFFDGDQLVGFALASMDERSTWHVDEIFVALGARRRGAGTEALVALTALHPGRWTLTVRPENPTALAFFRRVLGVAPTAEPGTDGIVRQRFSFDGPVRQEGVGPTR